MKTRIAVVAVVLLTAFAAFADEAAKTPAEKALHAWVDSFNTHDVAARKEFLKKSSALPEAQIEKFAEMDVEFRGKHGEFEIVKVVESTDTRVIADLRHKGSGVSPTVEIEVEAAAPHRIVNVGLKMQPRS